MAAFRPNYEIFMNGGGLKVQRKKKDKRKKMMIWTKKKKKLIWTKKKEEVNAMVFFFPSFNKKS